MRSFLKGPMESWSQDLGVSQYEVLVYWGEGRGVLRLPYETLLRPEVHGFKGEGFRFRFLGGFVWELSLSRVISLW